MPYGEILSPSSREIQLTGFAYGKFLKCKLAALTDDMKCTLTGNAIGEESPVRSLLLCARTEAHDSGVESGSSLMRSSPDLECSCRLGPVVLVQCNGFVQNIKSVSVAKVTCLSAIVSWTLEEACMLQDGLDLVYPESYKVECWKKQENENKLAFETVTSGNI